MNCAALKRFVLRFFVLMLVLVVPVSVAPANAQAGTNAATLNIITGWNLVGMGSSGSLDVATTFGDASKVTTVWKWLPSKGIWAFYTPLMAGQQFTDYAASKGYEILTTVDGGEGFWVNAKIPFIAQLPAGTLIASPSFQTSLLSGWNLIATGDQKTPREFNNALSLTPPASEDVPLNLTSLWAWDAMLTNWYFYAPSLDYVGDLVAYIESKGYLDFYSPVAKTLDPTTGFWANVPAAGSWYALRVDYTGSGSGSVSTDPNGPIYASDTGVTLLATPSAGSAFTGWSGACMGTAPICFTTMAANHTVIANFEPSPAVQKVLQIGRTVETSIIQDGSVMPVTSESGAAFTLSVPANSLVNPVTASLTPSPVTVSLTPVASVEGLPPEVGFVAGLQLSPSGLQFLRPSTLAITLAAGFAPDQLVVFGYRGSGEGLHLVPFTVAGNTITLKISHFSDVVVATAAASICASLPVPGQPADRAHQRLACVFKAAGNNIDNVTPVQADEIANILRQWFIEGVDSNLTAALNCIAQPGCTSGGTSLLAAINEFLAWDATLSDSSSGIAAALAKEWESGQTRMQNAIANLLDRLEQQCVGAANMDAKKARLNEILYWNRTAELLSFLVEVPLRQVCEICAGALQRMVQTVQLSPSTISIVVGQSVRFVTTIRSFCNTTLTDSQVRWSSDNVLFVSVDQSGLAVGVTKGIAMITATSEGMTGSATVTVTAPVLHSLEMVPSATTRQQGTSYELFARPLDAQGNLITGLPAIEWTSSDSAIARVTAWGTMYAQLFAQEIGSATVTASLQGVTGTVAVQVVPVVQSLQVVPSTLTLQPGESHQLSAYPVDAQGNAITGLPGILWTSSNPNVVGVYAGGFLYAYAIGSATITAYFQGNDPSLQMTGTAVIQVIAN